MKKTDTLYAGDTSRWALQSKRGEPERAPASWTSLEGNHGLPDPNPHMHTYGHSAEKWDHSGRSYADPRPLVKPPPPAKPSRSWGIEGDTPSGKGPANDAVLKVPAKEARISSKRSIVPAPSAEYGMDDVMSRKAHVYAASGVDMRQAISAEHRLEDALARKKAVPEEVRTEHRTIDRMAPPGLKGFLGAEYSNGYWAQDGVVVRQKLCPSKADLQTMELAAAMERAARLGVTKPFAQQKAEADAESERELVRTLDIPYDTLSDDEPRNSEK